MTMKSLEQYFADWVGDTIGFGYGTGEPHLIAAVRRFLELTPEGEPYDYRMLETELTPAVSWLLICLFGHHDLIEYGVSPRFAWLTASGKRLRAFMLSKTIDDLVGMARRSPDDEVSECYRNACNCSLDGSPAGRRCPNPFWCDDVPNAPRSFPPVVL